jgi:hypothetical protein
MVAMSLEVSLDIAVMAVMIDSNAMDAREQIQVIADLLKEAGFTVERDKPAGSAYESGYQLKVKGFAVLTAPGDGSLTIVGKRASDITAVLDKAGVSRHAPLTTKQRGKHREGADEGAAEQLLDFLDNEQPLFRFKENIAKNLLKHMQKVRYSSARAQDAWLHVANAAAQQWVREMGGRFAPATRELVAKWLAERWEANAKAGRPEEV